MKNSIEFFPHDFKINDSFLEPEKSTWVDQKVDRSDRMSTYPVYIWGGRFQGHGNHSLLSEIVRNPLAWMTMANRLDSWH